MLKYLVAPMCLLLAFSAAAFANGHSWDLQTVAAGINGANNHVQFVYNPDDIPVIGYMGDSASSKLRKLYISAEETSGVWTQRYVDKAYADYGAGGMAVDGAGNIYLSYVGDKRKIKCAVFDDAWKKSILSINNTTSGSGSGVAIDNLGRPVYEYSTLSGSTETLYIGVKNGKSYKYSTAAQLKGKGFDFETPSFDSLGNMMFTLVNYDKGKNYGNVYYYNLPATGKKKYTSQRFTEHASDADGLFIGVNNPFLAMVETVSAGNNRIVTYQYNSGLHKWTPTVITNPLDYTPVKLDLALDHSGALGLTFADKNGKVYYMHYDSALASWSTPSLVYAPFSAPANPGLFSLVLNYTSANEAAVAFYDPSTQNVMYALDPPPPPPPPPPIIEQGRVVPEPGVILMMGTGLAAIAGIARRMRK